MSICSLGLQFIYKPKAIACEATLNLPLAINDDRFNNCLPLTFKCKNEQCNMDIVITDTVTEFVSVCFSLIVFQNIFFSVQNLVIYLQQFSHYIGIIFTCLLFFA